MSGFARKILQMLINFAVRFKLRRVTLVLFSVGEAGLNGMNHAACDLFRNVCVQPGINYVYYYYYELLSSSK